MKSKETSLLILRGAVKLKEYRDALACKLSNLISKRQAKSGRKTCRLMRIEHSRSMLDMGQPAGHKLPVNDERTKNLLAAWRRRKK